MTDTTNRPPSEINDWDEARMALMRFGADAVLRYFYEWRGSPDKIIEAMLGHSIDDVHVDYRNEWRKYLADDPLMAWRKMDQSNRERFMLLAARDSLKAGNFPGWV